MNSNKKKPGRPKGSKNYNSREAGGSRPGAGRKPKEETRVIRVPVSKISEIKKLIEQ